MAVGIYHQIDQQLPRPVVGDLTTSVYLYQWDLTEIQQVFGFACLPLSKYRIMFNHP